MPVLLFLSEANMRIFLVFLKIGAILYGSGYVLFAFLDSELVAKGLLSRTQLVDAIAVGQFTPGPVFSSVTFVGWQMNGLPGAVMATVAIIVAVCIVFARETVTGWRTVLIAVLSLGVTFGVRKVNTVFVVAGSALAGYLLQLV
jgi:chromate transporter